MECVYKAIKVNGKKYDEHRYIMEQYLGRKLDENEVVHHKNGNKRDNRVENLEVMLRAEHSRNHMLGRTLTDTTRMKISESVKGIPRKNRKLSSTQVVEIRNQISAGKSSRKIAAQFGVCKDVILGIKHGTLYADIA